LLLSFKKEDFFFFEKKKQKTFIPWSLACEAGTLNRDNFVYGAGAHCRPVRWVVMTARRTTTGQAMAIMPGRIGYDSH
jgi:hypothetical protein